MHLLLFRFPIFGPDFSSIDSNFYALSIRALCVASNECVLNGDAACAKFRFFFNYVSVFGRVAV